MNARPIILMTTWAESWHNSTLGYAYRIKDMSGGRTRVEVLEQATGEWILSLCTREDLFDAIEAGSLKRITG